MIFLAGFFIAVDFRIALLMAVPIPLLFFVKIGLVVISLSSVYYIFILIIAISIMHKSRGVNG